jgi:hypothetical protein
MFGIDTLTKAIIYLTNQNESHSGVLIYGDCQMTRTPEQIKAFYDLPFQPLTPGSGAGPNIDAALRIASAIEYAAAQLGAIARAAEKTEAHLAKIAVHYPEPGSSEAHRQSSVSPKKT